MRWTAELVRERLNSAERAAEAEALAAAPPHPLLARDAGASLVSPVALGAQAGREAAVAIVLRFAPAAEVLLIRRAEQEGDPWSGHMAFPGGRRDESDPDLLATAIRESEEEVGIDLRAHADWLGRLPAVPAVARGRRLDLVIVPFVFAEREPLQTVAGPEVGEVLWAELEPLLAGRADTVRPYVFEGYPLELPAFRVGEHIIWGLTYRMLTMLFETMRA